MKNEPNIHQKRPLSVEAPIIVDGMTQEGVQPLIDFVSGLEAHTSETIAAAEGRRLAPYFGALSNYFRRALKSLAGEDELINRDKDALEKLTTPESLEGVFNAVSRRTHNAIISDVAILPNSIGTGPASHLFKHMQFQVRYNYRGHMFNFGFVQVHEDGDAKKGKSSTSFPTFILDKRMLDEIAPHNPGALLKEFQGIMSWVNHDMLHHFTSPIINPIVAKKFSFDDVVKPEDKNGPIHVWSRSLPRVNVFSSYYEQWALISHEKVMLAPGNEAQVVEVAKGIRGFFTELERVGADIARDKGPEKAHETVDYFGMMMAHALTRVFPLDHPFMSYCMECLQKADPLPEKSLEDARRSMPEPPKQRQAPTLRQYFARLIHAAPPPQENPKDPLTIIRSYADRASYMKSIATAYKGAGLDILPDDDAKVTYRNIKLLQLLQFSNEDIAPHVPASPDPKMAQVRERAERSMVGMIKAAAQSFGYTPQ